MNRRCGEGQDQFERTFCCLLYHLSVVRRTSVLPRGVLWQEATMSSLSKVLALLSLLFLLGQGPAASCQTFTNPVRVPTSVDPATVLAGDLNGDGRVDLIWFEVTTTSSIGHVELAQANGGYLAGTQVVLPGAPSGVPSCAVADVTRDAKPDLICATLFTGTATTQVLVFPGNGDGSFGTPNLTQFGNQLSQAILLTLVGDLNADGIPDFILEGAFYTPASVLLSDGEGGFLPAKTVPNSYNFSTPVAADINGDGIPDILWPQGAGVALGKGDGSFGDLLQPYSPGTSGPIDCAFHDMDGDGKLDAICGYIDTSNGIDAEPGTSLDILHGNGDGTFNPTPISHQAFGDAAIAGSGVGDFLNPVLVSDLNGDGIPDVVGFSGDGLAVLLGKPGLTFGAPAHYAPAFSGYAFSSQIADQTVYMDLNGDGLIDVLDAGPNGLYLLYGRADGSFGSAVATKVSEISGHIGIADFNGDGKPDIVSDGEPGTSLSLGNGDGSFAAPVAIPGAPFAAAAPLFVGDFNGDGKQDLLSTSTSYAYQLMFGNGDGTFGAAIATTGLAPAPSSTSTTANYTTPYALTADLNSDGKADLFYITSDSLSPTYDLVSALSNGDGSFKSVTTTYAAPPYPAPPYYDNPVATVLADFAHRGKLDAAYFLNESIYVVQGNGDGSFSTTPTMLATPTVGGVQADAQEALQVSDFDGDGNLDIAFLSWYQADYFYQGGPSCVFIYYGKGDGTFSSATPAGCFTHSYTDMRVGDFNGDGRPDLVLQTASALNVYVVGVIDNLGNRSFGPELNYTAGALNGDIFVSDLNLDGRPDLVFGNSRNEAGYSANSVTVLLNQSTLVATGALTSSPNPSYLSQAFTITATLTPPTPGTVYSGAITFYVDGNVLGSGTLAGNVATIAGPTTLAAGMHSLSATWPGDTNDPALTLEATHTVLLYPLQVTLNCTPNPGSIGQSVTLATQLTSTPPAGVPPATAPFSGTLSFYDGTMLLEQQQVGTAGFSYATSTLSGGTHALSASYTGDSVYATGTASCSEVVDKLPTTSQVSANITTAQTPFLFVGKVAAASASALSPTGTVSFTVDGAAAGTGTLDPATGIATYNDAGIGGGNHTLACTYSGDANFAASACPAAPVFIAAAPVALTLVSATNPAPAGSAIAFTANLTSKGNPASGETIAISIGQNGAAVGSASAITDASGRGIYTSPGLPPGTYTVSAVFSGDANLQSAVSTPLTEVVVINPSAMSLSATPNPGYVGDSITLTARVGQIRGSDLVPMNPSGTVKFFDGTTQVGSAPLNVSALAILSTTSLGPGVHFLTASYAGNTYFLGSTSAPYPETILPSTFAITLLPSTLTVQSGASGTTAVDLASVGDFAGPLSLTYGAPPTYSTIALSPASVTLTPAGNATAGLTVNTLIVAANTGSRSEGVALAVSAAGLFLLPLISRRKRLAKLLLAALACVGFQSLVGCTDHFYIGHGVAPATYTIPITATDAKGNAQTANLTLVITQ